MRGNDRDAFFAAGRQLAARVGEAPTAERDAAAALLAPVLAEASEPFGVLAQYTSALVGMDGDPTAVLDVLVERACRALEGAARFDALHTELVGPVPAREDCGDDELDRFVGAARERLDDPTEVALRWMYAESWSQPVLYLAQRVDVRRALPQRDRLLAAVVASEESVPGISPWLHGLLRILDDEPLVVLHRPTRTGFRVTTTGVADNFQLHTLLAAHVIPRLAARRGLLRRRSVDLPVPPSPQMTAAADGSGDPEPPGAMVGQFNLVDATGAWIWNEGRPDEIPAVDGERVIVLDPPAYERSWNTGRAYPLLRATVDVVPMAADEARAWSSRVAPAKPLASAAVPPTAALWTDDMTVPLPPGRTVGDVVDVDLALSRQGMSGDDLESAVAAAFSLTSDDAAVAVDRVLGGIVRAGTTSEANRPDPVKDPIAAESYRRAREKA